MLSIALAVFLGNVLNDLNFSTHIKHIFDIVLSLSISLLIALALEGPFKIVLKFSTF